VPAEPGLRERKKQRTRQALIDAAVQLFAEKGYDETTVADIAAAADVSTRTFFLHFPAKEAVVFANSTGRIDLALAVIDSRRPRESVRDLLVRAMDQMIDNSWASDLTTGLGSLRVRLLMSVPALQAAMLHGLIAAQAELAAAVRRAFPDEFDAIDAAAVVGALVGAVNAAALQSVQQGDSPVQVRAAMVRATEITARCLPGRR
jgi:AcrR family transcriptional regulator